MSLSKVSSSQSPKALKASGRCKALPFMPTAVTAFVDCSYGHFFVKLLELDANIPSAAPRYKQTPCTHERTLRCSMSGQSSVEPF